MDKPSYPNAMVSSQFHAGLKQKMARIEDHPYITEEDCCQLDRTAPLPHLRHIELQKYLPHHFGLARWQPTFLLPDSWMKRIYLHEVYSDTELPSEEPEKLTKVQKEILREHVEITRKVLDLPGIITKIYSRTKPPVDRLLEKLQNQENLTYATTHQQGCSSTDGIANLPMHVSHRVNCERMVAKAALEKMKTLSEAQERRYQLLLKDRRFMDKLNGLVETYLNENHCLETSTQDSK